MSGWIMVLASWGLGCEELCLVRPASSGMCYGTSLHWDPLATISVFLSHPRSKLSSMLSLLFRYTDSLVLTCTHT